MQKHKILIPSSYKSILMLVVEHESLKSCLAVESKPMLTTLINKRS